MKVCLYRCFAEDRRISMDVYADSLQIALKKNKNLDVNSFKPTSRLGYFSQSQSILRFLRYVHYPMSVRSVKADVHHIIDHGYAHLIPRISSGNTCVTVHDLIPLLSWNGAIEILNSDLIAQEFRKPYLNLYSLNYLNRFDKIIASSENTQKDLVNYLGIDETKITVIPPIISSVFQRASESQIERFRKKYKLSQSYKWLIISGNSYYKNHITCLKVLSELNKQSDIPIKLIRTGLASSEFEDQVQKLKLNGLVKNLYLPKQAELACLYSSVDCLLFPSLYEGFGMPVAEVLACGTPVITSNRGSLNEVAGELAPRFDPYDIFGLTRAVYQALFDTSFKKMFYESGPQWVTRYSEEAVAKKINGVYSLFKSRN